MRVYTIVLDQMEFFAFHGCLESEKTQGNTFVVDLECSYQSECGRTDDLSDAVNYGEIYNVIAAQMRIPANLLETVARRIMEELKAAFPQLLSITLTVSKKNPPVEGPCAWSRVRINWKRNE